MQRRLLYSPGFTLIEMLISLTVFVVVLFGVYVVYEAGEVNYATGTAKWDVQSQARLALDRMTREIRMAGYASPKVSDPVVIATNDTLAIHVDLDGTGPQYITYSRRDCSGTEGSALYRSLSTTTFCGGDTFIEGVTALTFTYYELNNVPLPSPLPSSYALDGQGIMTGGGTPSAPAAGSQRDRVRQVKISLTVQQQLRGRTVPFTMTTDVALRNLLP